MIVFVLCVCEIVIFKVYCADHTYTTMKTRVDTPALKIIRIAADKLGLRCDQPDDLKLCEVKSTGGLSSSILSDHLDDLFIFRTYYLQRQ